MPRSVIRPSSTLQICGIRQEKTAHSVVNELAGKGAITFTLPRYRHHENCSDSLTLGDFARRPTRSFKPLDKICDLDVMLDAYLCDGHLHKAEPFLDTFHPFVLAAMPTGPARRPRGIPF
jgi:hypothetical protein